jgi:SAM-dependent methyltransferase
MERDEYARMDAAEDGMWWYRAIHSNLLDALCRHPGPPAGIVLDAGCGTGGLLRRLRQARPDLRLLGIDADVAAAVRATTKAAVPVAVANVDALPFADRSMDVIFSVDVLYHRRVNPERAVAEAFRCLRPGGMHVVNVPAYRWLASSHDHRIHGARRFTRGELSALLAAAGFRQVEAGYWNCLPFPIMVLRRKVLPPKEEASHVVELPGLLERVLNMAMALERCIARSGLRYPFGGSVFAVALK